MRHVKIQSHVVDLRTIFSDSIWPIESDGTLKFWNFGQIDHFDHLVRRESLGNKIIKSEIEINLKWLSIWKHRDNLGNITINLETKLLFGNVTFSNEIRRSPSYKWSFKLWIDASRVIITSFLSSKWCFQINSDVSKLRFVSK